MRPIVYNTKKLKVLTDSGFRNFVGIVETNPSAETLRFDFDDGSHIEVTPNHRFITEIDWLVDGSTEYVDVHAQTLTVGDKVCTMMDEYVSIINISPGRTQPTYDLIEVGDNRFKTNNVISHNCEFISNDPLLIDSMTIARLEKMIEQPIRFDVGWCFWENIHAGKTYLLGVDPATGTGEDFTVMQVYDFHDMTPVAEFRSNTMSSPSAYASLKVMLNKIESVGSTCYFSVENNGVGEGIIALYENDENIPANCEFISEEGANRLGMRTESRVKLRTCLTLKRLIESGKLPVKSEKLLKELKSYIATKGSYAAMKGATDDIISSTLIVIRLLTEISAYEQRAHDMVHDYDDVESFTIGEDSEEYDENYEPDGFLG